MSTPPEVQHSLGFTGGRGNRGNEELSSDHDSFYNIVSPTDISVRKEVTTEGLHSFKNFKHQELRSNPGRLQKFLGISGRVIQLR